MGGTRHRHQGPPTGDFAATSGKEPPRRLWRSEWEKKKIEDVRAAIRTVGHGRFHVRYRDKAGPCTQRGTCRAIGPAKCQSACIEGRMFSTKTVPVLSQGFPSVFRVPESVICHFSCFRPAMGPGRGRPVGLFHGVTARSGSPPVPSCPPCSGPNRWGWALPTSDEIFLRSLMCAGRGRPLARGCINKKRKKKKLETPWQRAPGKVGVSEVPCIALSVQQHGVTVQTKRKPRASGPWFPSSPSRCCADQGADGRRLVKGGRRAKRAVRETQGRHRSKGARPCN